MIGVVPDSDKSGEVVLTSVLRLV